MIALTTIIYIALIVVFYKTLKIKPNAKNVAAMVVLGVVVIGAIVIMWKFAAPTSSNLVVSRYAIQIVPQVKGPISKIHAEPNVPLKKGTDKLFEVQKDLYQLAVSQTAAALDAAKKNALQVEAGVSVAAASVKQAEANLAAASAELDVAQETAKLNPDAVSRLTVIQLTEAYNAALAAVAQAQATEKQAQAALQAARAQIPNAKAQLDTAQFNLDQCTVYAPADGFVTNWQVREGTMAVSMPFAPVGTFIDTSRTTLVASFPQNIVRNVKPGDAVEIALKTRPGEIFAGTVEAIIQASGEGQFETSGQLQSASEIGSDGMFAVKFTLADVEIAQSLAMGTAGTVAIYTETGKAFQIISKVTIRMNAWMYYLIPT